MTQLKKYTVIGILFVIVTGTLTHFLYDWSGQNTVIGLFTPVNESIWEHIKLLFFPMLLYSLFMIFKFKPKYPCIVSGLCSGILAGALFIPLFYYAYTYVLGKNVFVLDIAIFLFSILTAFLLSCKLTLSCRLSSHTFLLCALVCLLFVCFLVFTYHPPDMAVFQDPAAMGQK